MASLHGVDVVGTAGIDLRDRSENTGRENFSVDEKEILKVRPIIPVAEPTHRESGSEIRKTAGLGFYSSVTEFTSVSESMRSVRL